MTDLERFLSLRRVLGISEGELPPIELREARWISLRRLESGFAPPTSGATADRSTQAPPAGAAGLRWVVAVIAAMLGLSVIGSFIALAFVGGSAIPGVAGIAVAQPLVTGVEGQQIVVGTSIDEHADGQKGSKKPGKGPLKQESAGIAGDQFAILSAGSASNESVGTDGEDGGGPGSGGGGATDGVANGGSGEVGGSVDGGGTGGGGESIDGASDGSSAEEGEDDDEAEDEEDDAQEDDAGEDEDD